MLRELVPWRDAIAGQLDRATFRVVGNEQLLDISRQQPATREALARDQGHAARHSRIARPASCSRR